MSGAEAILMRHEIVRALRKTRPPAVYAASAVVNAWAQVVNELAKEMYPPGSTPAPDVMRAGFVSECEGD